MPVTSPAAWDGHVASMAPPSAGGWLAVAAWASRGLDLGEQLLWVADVETPTTAALVPALAHQNVDAAAAVDAGQVAVVDPALVYRPGAYARLVDEALASGFEGVRCCGGRQAAASVVMDREFAAFERSAQREWEARGITLLCRFPSTLDAASQWQVAAAHVDGVCDRLLHAWTPEPGRIVLYGEIDLSNDALLRAVLAEAIRRSDDQLIVDCAELRFASVGAWSGISDATRRHRVAGGQVRLAGLSRIARRVLSTTTLDRQFVLD